MTQPLVTIVLPTFNRAGMLGGALDSCLAQTWRNLEIIVVDDASTDGTAGVVEERSRRDERVRYIRNPENRRLPGSLNVGFAASRGDYLTWTSDDNLYRPMAIERMVRGLQSHPGTSLVYADYTLIDEKDVEGERVCVRPVEDILSASIIGACFLYTRAVHEDIGPYNEDLFLVEDYEYFLRICCRFRAAPLHEDLYLYRNHPDSLTAHHYRRVWQMTQQLITNFVPRYHGARGRLGARAHLMSGRWAFNDRSIRKARGHLWRALMLSPMAPFRHDPGLIAGAILGPKGWERAKGVHLSLMRRKRPPVGAEDTR